MSTNWAPDPPTASASASAASLPEATVSPLSSSRTVTTSPTLRNIRLLPGVRPIRHASALTVTELSSAIR